MTDSVDTLMYQNPSEVDEPRLETLQVLKENGGDIRGFKQIAESRDVSKQAASKLLSKMEEEGLVGINRDGNAAIISLTANGRDIIRSTPYPTGSVDSSYPVNKRAHAISATVRPKNSGEVPREWWSRLVEKEQVDVLKDEANDTIVARDRWVFRCHKESVTLQNREGVSIDEDEVGRAMLRLSAQLQDVARWLSSVVGVEFQVQQIDIGHLEIAFEEDHQALLADAVPGLELSDISVYDGDVGQDVVQFDKSKGVPERETLSGVRAEEIARTIQRENRQLALNADAVEKRHGWENELAIKDINPVGAVQKLERVEELESKQEQLLELKSAEREKTEALEKNVQALQNVVMELVERQQKSSSYEDIVQEKYAEYDRDPEYSEPFFHKDSGGLYAFRRDGSGCEKILSGEKVERLS